jgi:hypothetical protein
MFYGPESRERECVDHLPERLLAVDEVSYLNGREHPAKQMPWSLEVR